MKNSAIEWTDHTFNPWRGCTKVSPACDHCYAATMSKRNPAVLGIWGDDGTRVVASEDQWSQPPKWNKAAKVLGVRKRVFCASLADVFEDWNGPMLHSSGVPMWQMYDRNGHPRLWGAGHVLDDPNAGEPLTMVNVRSRLFDLIDETPELDWLLLTKRPKNIAALIPMARRGKLPPNVQLGCTVENQETADDRIAHLLKARVAVRFLSMEPLLGPVDLLRVRCGEHLAPHAPDHRIDVFRLGMWSKRLGYTSHSDLQIEYGEHGIDWIIAGGESGPGARPSHPDWFRDLREQCEAANVPFFFKQWGDWIPYEHDAQPPFLSSQHGDMVDGHLLPEHLTDKVGEEQPGGWMMDPHCDLYRRVGKKNAGRLLDGVEWNQVPTEIPTGFITSPTL